jgi:hypothetical protein
MPVDDMPIKANINQLLIDADDVLQDDDTGGRGTTCGPPDDEEGGETNAYLS